jgi:hypothetical protein
MLDTLRAWLNGKRNYFTGVVLYAEVGGDKDLLNVLQKGPNDFRVRRLHEELVLICDKLKEKSNAKILRDPTGEKADQERVDQRIDRHPQNSIPANPDLYAACKSEADLAYKKIMNDRAVLFAMANASAQDFTDPNMPDKVQARQKLSLDVVIGWQKVSELYDRADYVKVNGRLPETEDHNESEYDNIPDSLVKQALDNARKAFNKLNVKEHTPARIELMQRHQINIKKLKDKWHSLKPA